jgi:hypothetical protein
MYKQFKRTLPTFIAVAALSVGASVTSAQETGSTCSDMSEHQQVLDAGMKFYNENGGGGSGAGIEYEAESASLVKAQHPQEHNDQIPDQLSSPFAHSSLFRSSSPDHPLYDLGYRRGTVVTRNDFQVQQVKVPEPDVKTIRLASENDLSSAELYAQGREIAGDYTAAEVLYTRISAFHRAQLRTLSDSASQDIDRVKLCQSARACRLEGQARSCGRIWQSNYDEY